MKETVIQFGTGNFLRGFIEDFFDIMQSKGLYDGKIVIVQPTKGGKAKIINEQKGKYNLILQGENECEIKAINSVSRGVDPYEDFSAYLALAENSDMHFIISNTTEGGIEFNDSCTFDERPAISFPGKLTQLLYHRYELNLDGFIILPCELIDQNGDKLKSCVIKYAELWHLGEDFINWIENENKFCNTLVDRIVSGYPKDDAKTLISKIGYDDKLLDAAEKYHLWVIEGDFENELPLKKAGINVIWASDVSLYKKMKVRILNGSHTCLAFPSLLLDKRTVYDSLCDDDLKAFLTKILTKYILPCLPDDKAHKDFALAVTERFSNGSIKHMWQSIALNSVSKWRVRVLPTVLDYYHLYGTLPRELSFSLSCLIAYYKKNAVADEEYSYTYIKENSVDSILSNTRLWGKDLSGLAPDVSEGIERIENNMREALKWAMS